MKNNVLPEVLPNSQFDNLETTVVRLKRPIIINDNEKITEVTLREPLPKDLMDLNISRGDLFMMNDATFIKLLPAISTPFLTRQHYNQLGASDSQKLISETLMFFQ